MRSRQSSPRRTSSTASPTPPATAARSICSASIREAAVAIEDSEAGVSAAKTAGLYTVAVTGTVGGERLREARTRSPGA